MATRNSFLKIFILPLIFLCSCSHSHMMTYDTYDHVQVGSSVESLMEKAGKPYATHLKKDGTVEYEYIERINQGNSRIAENHYFITVQEGMVVGKYVTRERPPPYDLIYQEEPNYPGYNP
jgi:hypothetical protein